MEKFSVTGDLSDPPSPADPIMQNVLVDFRDT